MTVKDALTTEEELCNLAENLRLLHQYFINTELDKRNEIEKKVGMNIPIEQTLDDAHAVIDQITKHIHERIMEINVSSDIEALLHKI